MSRFIRAAACILLCLGLTLHVYLIPALPATFSVLQVQGFGNHGSPGNVTCASLAKPALLKVEPSIHLYDDLPAIATSLQDHPMIKYPPGRTIQNSWLRLAGASVWLPRHQVFFAITRIIFFDNGQTDWPVISFIRAQLYDETWTQVNKTLGGLAFPCILDIPTQYEQGGKVYGPEDARILEQDSQPVIIFNMISRPDWKRAMHIHRPFFNDTIRLRIRGRPAQNIEKNWAPFFHGRGHINFVYTFSPLQVLWCSMSTGDCDMAYDQATLAPGMLTDHQGDSHALKGGTNLVHHRGSWISLPRTHINAPCDGPLYRPMFFIMTHTGMAYYSTWASGPVDFGDAVLTPQQRQDCRHGRILIPNSISRWDKRRDIMTIAFSVGDRTNQIARVHGLMALMESGPDLSVIGERFLENADLSAVGNDVARCGIEASLNGTRHLVPQ